MTHIKTKSFTLIELLVVISIIGLLSSIVLVNTRGSRDKAKIAKSLETSQAIHNSLGSEAVGVWDFDNCTGQDSSGNGNNGTISGAVCSSDTPYSVVGQGSGKNSLSFDGVDDYVTMPHSANLEPASIAVAFWAKLEDQSDRHCLVTKWSGFTTEVNADRTFRWGLLGPSNQYFGTKKINWNQWYYLVGTFDNTTKRQCIYINGTQTECQTVTGDINYNQSPLYLSGAWDHAKGLIDDVRIYSQALSQSQIQQQYVEGLKIHNNLVLLDK